MKSTKNLIIGLFLVLTIIFAGCSTENSNTTGLENDVQEELPVNQDQELNEVLETERLDNDDIELGELI